MSNASTRRVVKCPVRPGEPCTLCQLDVTGPQDCGLVYLVMHDPELREGLRLAQRPGVPAMSSPEDGARVAVCVAPTDEEREIARQTRECVART